MPLLRKQPYVVQNPLPLDATPDPNNHFIRFTREVFTNIEDYNKQLELYLQKIWTCKVTGKSGLSYEDALESEKKAVDLHEKFPPNYEEAAIRLAHHSTCKLELLCGKVLAYFKDHYAVGEEVVGLKEGVPHACLIQEELPPKDAGSTVPLYRVQFIAASNSRPPVFTSTAIVPHTDLVRKRFHLNKPIIKSWLMAMMTCEVVDAKGLACIWQAKPEMQKKYNLPQQLPMELEAKLEKVARRKAEKERKMERSRWRDASAGTGEAARMPLGANGAAAPLQKAKLLIPVEGGQHPTPPQSSSGRSSTRHASLAQAQLLQASIRALDSGNQLATKLAALANLRPEELQQLLNTSGFDVEKILEKLIEQMDADKAAELLASYESSSSTALKRALGARISKRVVGSQEAPAPSVPPSQSPLPNPNAGHDPSQLLPSSQPPLSCPPSGSSPAAASKDPDFQLRQQAVRQAIFDLLRAAGPQGLTVQEIWELLRERREMGFEDAQGLITSTCSQDSAFCRLSPGVFALRVLVPPHPLEPPSSTHPSQPFNPEAPFPRDTIPSSSATSPSPPSFPALQSAAPPFHHDPPHPTPPLQPPSIASTSTLQTPLTTVHNPPLPPRHLPPSQPSTSAPSPPSGAAPPSLHSYAGLEKSGHQHCSTDSLGTAGTSFSQGSNKPLPSSPGHCRKPAIPTTLSPTTDCSPTSSPQPSAHPAPLDLPLSAYAPLPPKEDTAATALEQVPAKPPLQVKREQFSKNHNKCAKCQLTQREDKSLLCLCDYCPRAWHLSCMNMKLGQLPPLLWACPRCLDRHGHHQQPHR